MQWLSAEKNDCEAVGLEYFFHGGWLEWEAEDKGLSSEELPHVKGGWKKHRSWRKQLIEKFQLPILPYCLGPHQTQWDSDFFF